MKFDDKKKVLETSVREIAFSSKSSNGERYISRRLRAQIGHRAHSTYQKHTDGITEYYVKFQFPVDDWIVHIKGRVDVVHKKENKIHLEEIKSVTSDIREVVEDENHILQLQLYCYYFYEYEGFSEISADLILIDPINKKRKRISVEPIPIKELLRKQLKQLIKDYKKHQIRKNALKQRVSTIKFPYTEYRPFQKEIIEKLEQLVTDKSNIMLHAPPGIGKTITTLFPSLVYTIGNSKKLFIVTSKTTQQINYISAFEDLKNSGAEFKTIRITAKGKICKTDKFECYDQLCPYLDNYFNINIEPLVSELLNLELIERGNVERLANNHKICPFELSLDVALQCDVILSDFNYIFDPRVQFQRFKEVFEDSILIVDEAHNLVDRAADSYSDSLGIEEIQATIRFVRRSLAPESFKRKLISHLKRLVRHIQRLKDQIPNLEVLSSLVYLDLDLFESFQYQLDNLSIEYLNSLPAIPEKKDQLIKFSDHLKYFTLLLREANDQSEFDEIYDLDRQQARILCKSAAKKLQEQMAEFESVIVQSATLQPLEYYQTMLGLSEDTKILKYPSPFPEKNRLYLIADFISTTYKERHLFTNQLADLIANATGLKKGNYLVFFSSFAYLNQVYTTLQPITSRRIFVQKPEMSDEERSKLLKSLEENNNLMVLAVMGGIFSEGIDYTGDMAIGAIIVGPGLPALSFDQELKKQYFASEYQRGFDYAYRFPGMSKVIQAAGRVFRTESDKGYVLFVGHRFNTIPYRSLLPTDYQIITGEVLKHIREFWNSHQD